MSLGGVNTDFSGSALSSLTTLQSQLSLANNQASSGKRIVNASIDPSGLAIYNSLSQQSSGADTANGNISDAQNAINVAQGTTSGIQDSLSQLSTLAVQAGNGFLSSSDRAALQAQANQLVQQINTEAAGSNFNGTALANGQNAGSTPATSASATVTNSDLTASGSQVVTSASASATTTSGTFNVQIANTGAGAVANVTFTDSATQQTTVVGSFAANSSTTSNGTTLNFGNFSTADTSTSATVQTTAAQAGATAGAVTVQSGANAGQTTTVDFANATTSGLGIQNIDLSSSASATNSLGQINAAITSLGANQAQLGAESSSLQAQFNNNNVLSNNLAGSASAIGDTQYGSTSSQINAITTQQQITTQVLNQANNTYGHLNAFLSVFA